ncbi:MAG: leucine-rich repeat domain-containing protein [Oscillospiraceae bacterium]|jgi:hypothetical protein|nr:leucine-rich repeat domain-containing protein [Oscillospiraceae bacterium]
MAYNTLTDMVQDVADAIREKDGSSELIPVADYGAKIRAIPTGGTGGGSQGGVFTGIRYVIGNYDPSGNTPRRKIYQYHSDSYTLTLSSVGNYGTISGNGTRDVTLTITDSVRSDFIKPFTITAAKNGQSRVFDAGIYYIGSTVNAASHIILYAKNFRTPHSQLTTFGNDYGYILSNSLPTFSSNGNLWYGTVYSHQIIAFSCAKDSSGITSIDNYCLSYCYSLKNADLSALTNVTSIGHNFLSNCTGLSDVDLSGFTNVTSIGDNFMGGCYAITDVDLSAFTNVIAIGQYAMISCYALQSIDLSAFSKLQTIGVGFLQQCHNLTYVDISALTSLISISHTFLHECYGLNTLNVGGSPNPIGAYSLAQLLNTKTSNNGTGILLLGTAASTWKAALPNRTTSPYRKLVV